MSWCDRPVCALAWGANRFGIHVEKLKELVLMGRGIWAWHITCVARATSHAIPGRKGNICITATRNVVSDVGLENQSIQWCFAEWRMLVSGRKRSKATAAYSTQRVCFGLYICFLVDRLLVQTRLYFANPKAWIHSFIRFQRLLGPAMTSWSIDWNVKWSQRCTWVVTF